MKTYFIWHPKIKIYKDLIWIEELLKERNMKLI